MARPYDDPGVYGPPIQRKKRVPKVVKPAVFSPSVVPNAASPAAPYTPRGQSNPYAGLLDAYMGQMRADTAAQGVADKAGRDAAIRRFLVSYGEVPKFGSMGLSDAAKSVLGGLDDVRDLAARNTAEGTSIKARLDQANAIAQRKIPATLAGRGLLRSGQTGYDLGQQAMQNKQTNFDVLNELLGNIEGSVSNYAQAEAARARALADAELQAAMAAQGDYGGGIYGDEGGAGAGRFDYLEPYFRPGPSVAGTPTRRRPQFTYAGTRNGRPYARRGGI